MPWQDFELLLTEIFDLINTTNVVPEPEEIFAKHETAIRSLAGGIAGEQFLLQSSSPEVISIRAIEILRLLKNLKRRMTAGGESRELVAKIRAAVVSRSRPPFDVPVSSIAERLRDIASLGKRNSYSQFQISGWQAVSEALEQRDGLVVVAPTGAGKSEVFMLPVIQRIAQHIANDGIEDEDPRFIFLYPRVELLKDQISRIFKYVYNAERDTINSSFTLSANRKRRAITIGFQFGGILSSSRDTRQNREIFNDEGVFRILDGCPVCALGKLVARETRNKLTPLVCSNKDCDAEFMTTIGKHEHVDAKVHILVSTDEALNRFYLTPRPNYESYLRSITGIIFDEAHLYYSLHGAHLFNLIRNIERLHPAGSRPLAKIASSATISNPEQFAAKLFHGRDQPPVRVHDAADYPSEPSGVEVIYFLQKPDDDKVLVGSTMIQAVMCFGHGVFRNLPEEEMERAILFTDSVDMASRFQNQIQDAESDRQLWQFRTVVDDIVFNGSNCPRTDPINCSSVYKQGECWRGIIGAADCVTSAEIRVAPMQINRITSQRGRAANYWEGEVVVATAALEVGVDDQRIKTIFHFRPPRDVFSFIQRRGRAGRGGDELAYNVITLDTEPSDQFYFYRRKRLLSPGSYELPLNPQNKIIERMHAVLAEERGRMGKAESDLHSPMKGILKWLQDTMQRCSVVTHLFGANLSGIFEHGDSDNVKRAFIDWCTEQKNRFENYLNVIWTLEEIQDQCPDTIKGIAERVLELVQRYVTGDKSVEAEIEDDIRLLGRLISDLQYSETDEEVIDLLEKLRGKLLNVWRVFRMRISEVVAPELARGFYEFFRELLRLDDEEWKFKVETEVIKTVLQAFFYLGLETLKDKSHIDCKSCMEFFVPNTFFQQVKPLIVELNKPGLKEEDANQEGVTSLSTMFYPYKTFYRYFGSSDLSVIDTVSSPESVRFEEDGTVVRLRLQGAGLHSGDTFMPQRIRVKPIRSDEHGTVLLCKTCYSIYGLNRQTTCCGKRLERVKLWSQPIIERRAFPRSETLTRVSQTLDLLELEGDTTVLGATVSGTTYNRHGSFNKRLNQFEFRTEYDRPVAYRIPTKGLRWNLGNAVTTLLADEEFRSRLPIDPLTPELILHTAAHMLYKASAAISGVNQEILEYAIDLDSNFVYVWERYEGGAGITELLRESLKTDPSELYRELLASAVCPIQLDQDTSWRDIDELRERLSAKWLLPDDDKVIDAVATEAEAERLANAGSEISSEGVSLSCPDGCPVCIQVTSCTSRPEQSIAVSRAVAERIMLSLVSSVNDDELTKLLDACIALNIVPPKILSTDPRGGESNVLLL